MSFIAVILFLIIGLIFIQRYDTAVRNFIKDYELEDIVIQRNKIPMINWNSDKITEKILENWRKKLLRKKIEAIIFGGGSIIVAITIILYSQKFK